MKSSPSEASLRGPTASDNSPKFLHFSSIKFVRHQYICHVSTGRWTTDLEKRIRHTITMQERIMIFCSLLLPYRKYEKSSWLLGGTGLIWEAKQGDQGCPSTPNPSLFSNTQANPQSSILHSTFVESLPTYSQLPPNPYDLNQPLYIQWSSGRYRVLKRGGMEETLFHSSLEGPLPYKIIKFTFIFLLACFPLGNTIVVHTSLKISVFSNSAPTTKLHRTGLAAF